MQSPSSLDGKLPVFVFPSSLTFYADDQSSHKQVLTVYNPYEFAVKFRVLSTAPKKYVVVDSEGIIKSQCCIDIVIRHNTVNQANHGVTDKFRIQLQEHGHRQVIGRKDILATLLPTKPELSGTTAADTENFEQLHSDVNPVAAHSKQYALNIPSRGQIQSKPSKFTYMVGFVCVLLLALPREGEMSSCLPPYLHISYNLKLVAAYFFGMVTLVVFRP